MFGKQLVKAVIVAVISLLLTQSTSYAAGRSSSETNTILSGSGVPASTIGINGDFYIDIKSMNIYGPKKNNRWPIPTSLRGPAGPIGPSGADGKNGSAGSTADGKTGASGPSGPSGPAGPAGPAGAKGETGATGAAGVKGDTGATGATGATGSSGSSAVQFVNLTQWTMSTATPGGGSESTIFGTLAAGKKYAFTIQVNGKLPTNVSVFRTFPVLKCTESGADFNYEYSYGFGQSSDLTTDFNRISFTIVGTISVTSDSNFSVLVRDVDGSNKLVTLNGKALIQEVGSIN
ncbi:MAG: hypothetical protein ACKO3J_01145 [Candidatus Nanopelagicus sp.]